jgi:hypothetical protein
MLQEPLGSVSLPVLLITAQSLRTIEQRIRCVGQPAHLIFFERLSKSIGPRAFAEEAFLQPISSPIAPQKRTLHSIRRVEIQSIRDVAMGSIARLSHQAISSPKR